MKKTSITIISLILLVACTKEEITSRTYPRVLTNNVDRITSSGASLHGEIILNPSEIIDHGFIWATYSSMAIGFGEMISLGPKKGTGTFGSALTSNLVRGTKYYVMSYAQSSSHTVYGNVVEFELPK